MENVNKSRLFTAACMALTVTSMTFAIRAGMIGDLGKEFSLTDTQLGWITGMAFFGFPVATTLGGFFVDIVGMKRWMWLAFAAHLLGLVLTIFAGGFWTLFISTFLIGFANGSVEAVCNPLVASMYTENKTTMLNKFHVWFPGGIVIGSLLGYFMKDIMHIGWQFQVATIILPTIAYAYLFWGQKFPPTERVAKGYSMSEMISACASPLFIFMAVCMFFTANTELSTNQYMSVFIGPAGVNGLLVLALINGLMAIGRFFGGPVIHSLNPVGVLLASAIIATLGLYLLGHTSGNTIYLAAAVFAIGCCYFWPTMLGFVNENLPKTGALGLSLMGGAGMFGAWAYQSFFIGPKLDALKISKAGEAGFPVPEGLVGDKIVAFFKTIPTDIFNKMEIAAGQLLIGNINWLPVFLTAAFGGLYFWMKNRK